MMIVDEIQRVPELLLSIKKIVGESISFNRFCQYSIFSIVLESLAGRIRKIRLHPLSQGEIHGILPPTFVHNASSDNIKNYANAYDRDNILELAFKGGFPVRLELNAKEKNFGTKII